MNEKTESAVTAAELDESDFKAFSIAAHARWREDQPGIIWTQEARERYLMTAAYAFGQAALAQPAPVSPKDVHTEHTLAASPSPGLADMAAFGASEAACYEYPEADQAPLREAFCKGAALAASPSPGLREACDYCDGDCKGAWHDCPRKPGLRDAVIEECAKVALAQRVEGEGRPSWNAACAAVYAAIRALATKEDGA